VNTAPCNECGSVNPVPGPDKKTHGTVKPGIGRRRIFCNSTQEIAMASFRKRLAQKRLGTAHIAFVAATIATALLGADAATASQGPGGGPGTASSFTQLAMAVIVYGGSALVVGAGLIGAVRGR
jgi:hypothetical protein